MVGGGGVGPPAAAYEADVYVFYTAQAYLVYASKIKLTCTGDVAYSTGNLFNFSTTQWPRCDAGILFSSIPRLEKLINHVFHEIK